MPSLRITRFGGVNLEVSPRLAPSYIAQVAHNCLLWDGVLRPLAQWKPILGVNYATAYSIDVSADNSLVKTYLLRNAKPLKGDNYPENTVVGITYTPYGAVDANINYLNTRTPPGGMPVGVQKPILTSQIVTHARAYKSDKPVNRVYGVTGIRVNGNGVEEGPLTVMSGQNLQQLIYEGDYSVLACIVNSPSVPFNGWRLYRTISGFNTAGSPNNEFDTDWFLVAESRNFTALSYNDDGAATTDPLDLYLADRFYPPPAKFFQFLDVLDGGWIVAVTEDGYMAVSERYLYHAWPTENYFKIPGETVTDMVASSDNVFIGTKNRPYIASVAAGEKAATQCAIEAYREAYECLPNSMDATPSGAMYASPSGIISLTRQGMNLLSAGVTSGVLPLGKVSADIDILDPETLEVSTVNLSFDMKYEHTRYGAYYHGTYFGFCTIPTGYNEIIEGEGAPYEGQEVSLFRGYMFDTGSSLDGTNELAKFSTLDTPAGVRAHVTGGTGLYVLSAEGIFRMPFPDNKDRAYQRAKKYCYEWKSKKFVFPGEMVFTAAKVVHDCDGDVNLAIYADCECVYEVSVKDCLPFQLPPAIVGTTFEVKLTGTASIHEVHLASSLRELLESE